MGLKTVSALATLPYYFVISMRWWHSLKNQEIIGRVNT